MGLKSVGTPAIALASWSPSLSGSGTPTLPRASIEGRTLRTLRHSLSGGHHRADAIGTYVGAHVGTCGSIPITITGTSWSPSLRGYFGVPASTLGFLVTWSLGTLGHSLSWATHHCVGTSAGILGPGGEVGSGSHHRAGALSHSLSRSHHWASTLRHSLSGGHHWAAGSAAHAPHIGAGGL